MLSPRQQLLLRKVVDCHTRTGQPVGSKALASSADVEHGASTVRNELAVLEERGLLAHPHTSAGRIPTEAGYRYYVDHLLGPPPDSSPGALGLALVRREVDDALRAATVTLSQVTNLLAIISSPPIGATSVRHVEVLLLQPQVLIVVVITSTGEVTKRAFTFAQPVDPGLADWAGAYLNEQLSGHGLGTRTLRSRLDGPGLTTVEREFVGTLAPLFLELDDSAEAGLYVDGTHRLFVQEHGGDVSELHQLMETLERRTLLLGVLRQALNQREVYVRIGGENELPGMVGMSMVAANYGLPQRNLGTVSIIGPTRMDYRDVVGTVRSAAADLSTYVENVWTA